MQYYEVAIITSGIYGGDEYVETISDSFSFQDDIYYNFLYVISDNLSFQDDVYGNFITAIPDSLSFQDNLYPEFLYIISDSVSFQDNLYYSFLYIISDSFSFQQENIFASVDSTSEIVSDTISFSDSIATPSIIIETISDTVIFDDAVVVIQAEVVILSDAFEITDSQQTIFITSFLDTVALSDSFLLSIIIPSTDDMSFADDLFVVFVRDVIDDISLTDDTVLFFYIRVFSVLSLIDTIKHVYERRLHDIFSTSADDATFVLSKTLSISDDLLLDTSILLDYISDARILSLLSYIDSREAIGNYKSSIADNFNHVSSIIPNINSNLVDYLLFLDTLDRYNAEFIVNQLSFDTAISPLILPPTIFDTVYLTDDFNTLLQNNFNDFFTVSDFISAFRNIRQVLFTTLTYRDFVDFVREALIDVVYLYVNFYMPERFSIIETKNINRSDTIFSLPDGLYTFDFSVPETNTSIVLNLAQLLSSKVKRIDKVYYSTNPEEVVIYTEDGTYSLEGTENYVSVPKGIRGKDLKIALHGMKEAEYVNINLFVEGRSKK